MSNRRKTIVKWIGGGLIVAMIALQAVTRLLSGNLFYGNYYNQPLNPFLQLIIVASVLIAGIVLLWRYLRSR